MRRSRSDRVAALAILAAASSAGCGDRAQPEPPPGPPPAVAAPADPEPARSRPTGPIPFDPATATAILEVRTLLRGEPPRMRPIRFDADAECARQNPDPVLDPEVIVRDGRLANVIVWMSRGAERRSFAVPDAPVALEMARCMFEPHVLTLGVGQPLSVANNDPTLHHFHAVAQSNPEFLRRIERKERGVTIRFATEEVGIRFKCDVHGWMTARAGVFAHPFHGVTDDRGQALLRLPPGEFEVSVWHEYGAFTKPAPQVVTLVEDGTADLEFVFESR